MKKLYTKYGDGGVTFTKKNPKTPKNEIIVHLLGEIDELNSCIGYLTSLVENNIKKDELIEILHQVMSVLFSVGAYVGYEVPISESKLENFVTLLENKIDYFESKNQELKNFILPTGGACSGYAHVCRSVCRRVERSLYDLYDAVTIETISRFFNRLGDFLFSMARTCNRYETKKDIIWKNTLGAD